MIFEQGFPSSPTVVEPRFSCGNSEVEQGLLHGFMSAEQGLPHQGSTVEYDLLSSHVFGIMDEDIQRLEGGDQLHLVAVRQLRVSIRSTTGTQAPRI